MMGVQPPGQRSERRKNDFRRRDHETAAGDLAAFQVDSQFRMIMARHFGTRVAALRLVPQDNSGEFYLILDPAAAMVGEARVVVADDPRPVEPACQFDQQFAGVPCKPDFEPPTAGRK